MKSSLLIFFLVLFFLLSSLLPLTSCQQEQQQISYTSEEASLLFSGFNTVLGPLLTNLPFDDPPTATMMKRMHTGLIRGFAGSANNFWNFSSGNYTTPCDNPKVLIGGKHCHYAKSIGDSFHFSPDNFVKAFTNQQEQNSSDVQISWVLNLFSYQSEEEMIPQIELLSQLHKKKKKTKKQKMILELGNEYFIDFLYFEKFPSCSAYVNLLNNSIVPAIRRNFFGEDALIAAVMQGTENSAWDKTLAEANKISKNNKKRKNKNKNEDKFSSFSSSSSSSPLFDAVTFHDYSLTQSPFQKGGNSTIALYGPTLLPQVAKRVRNLFGSETKILNSEFGYSPVTGSIFIEHKLQYSALRALFAVNWMIAAACETEGQFLTVQLHMLFQQQGMESSVAIWLMNWGAVQLRANTSQAPAEEFTRWTALAQILAQLSYFTSSNLKYDKSTCLGKIFSDKNDGNDVKVQNGKAKEEGVVSCLRGLQFTNNRNQTSLAGVLSNGCEEDQKYEMIFSQEEGGGGRNRGFKISIYRHDQGVGDNYDDKNVFARLSDCGKDSLLFECGPVVPTKLRLESNSAGVLSLLVPKLSILFLEAE